MNPPGIFNGGERLEEYSSKLMLPASGRLLPEFDVDKRRSIKDMFSRKASNSPKPSSTPIVPNTATSKENGDPPASTPLTGGPPSLSRKRSQPLPISPVKRSKSTAASSNASTPGQKTLAGFFKPKTTGSNAATVEPSSSTGLRNNSESTTMMDAASSKVASTHEDNVPPSSTETPFTDLAPSKLGDDMVIDPIVSKQDWGKLFTKKRVPKCDGHSEPCISLTTKKPGMNQGRAFWICPRPLGPSGEKEKGTQWRCSTFIWSSDWNSSSTTES